MAVSYGSFIDGTFKEDPYMTAQALAGSKTLTPSSAKIYFPDGSTQNISGDPSTFGKTALSLGGSLTPYASPFTKTSEPAAISSVSGADSFATKVQPAIDSANKSVQTASDNKSAIAAARTAAESAVASGEAIPQDVLDELKASTSPEDQAYAALLTGWSKQEQSAKDTYASLSVAAHESANAQIALLNSQWTQRKALLEQANAADVANWNQQFLRTGQAEYSPGMTGTFLSGKEQEGIRKVQALDDEYNSKINSINAALNQNDYELAARLTEDLTGIQDKAASVILDNAKVAADRNQAIEDATKQAKLEMNISSAVDQGLTSAGDIQKYLQDTGIAPDASLDQIDSVLKIVNPSEDLSGLSADYKTFRYLKDNKDPAVEGLDYIGYLKAVHIATTNQPSNSNSFKFSQVQNSQLLSGGFTQSEVDALQSDVATYGIDTTVSGLPQDQQDLIRRVLTNSNSFTTTPKQDFTITRESLRTAFGDNVLRKAARKPIEVATGIPYASDAEVESYLDTLMSTVEQYRAAGMSDADIMKQMQG